MNQNIRMIIDFPIVRDWLRLSARSQQLSRQRPPNCPKYSYSYSLNRLEVKGCLNNSLTFFPQKKILKTRNKAKTKNSVEKSRLLVLKKENKITQSLHHEAVMNLISMSSCHIKVWTHSFKPRQSSWNIPRQHSWNARTSCTDTAIGTIPDSGLP